jgi:hypothetical protein
MFEEDCLTRFLIYGLSKLMFLIYLRLNSKKRSLLEYISKTYKKLEKFQLFLWFSKKKKNRNKLTHFNV